MVLATVRSRVPVLESELVPGLPISETDSS